MSSTLDLLIRGGSVVTPDGVRRADIGISEGHIAQIAASITTPASETIAADGLHVFPGILDAHVHFNDPGREAWEGLATGSAALAAGGGTAFCDMPLNSNPPVLDAVTFAAKRARAEKLSLVDFAIWGGLVPGNLDKLGELHGAGAIALKAFMCGSGIDEFPGVTDAKTLREGMKRAAALGMIVGVHAEDDALAKKFTDAARARGETDARSWLATRPIEVELAAIRTALELAGETRCALHIVHVSSLEGIALITDAKKRGVDVTAETCPHYLLLHEGDVVRLGAPAKCAPPLRSVTEVDGLWRAFNQGAIDTIGSDHSPAPPEMKTSPDFFAIWGGISGCQHGFPLLVSESIALSSPDVALCRLSAMLAENVARRFRLARTKGRIAEGCDADFALFDLRGEHTLRNDELLYRHKQGPYDGRRSRARVVRTIVRGRSVFSDGRIAPGAVRGQFLRPETS